MEPSVVVVAVVALVAVLVLASGDGLAAVAATSAKARHHEAEKGVCSNTLLGFDLAIREGREYERCSVGDLACLRRNRQRRKQQREEQGLWDPSNTILILQLGFAFLVFIFWKRRKTSSRKLADRAAQRERLRKEEEALRLSTLTKQQRQIEELTKALASVQATVQRDLVEMKAQFQGTMTSFQETVGSIPQRESTFASSTARQQMEIRRAIRRNKKQEEMTMLG